MQTKNEEIKQTEKINLSQFKYKPHFYNETYFKYIEMLGGSPIVEETIVQAPTVSTQELTDDFPPAPETVIGHKGRPKGRKSVGGKRQKRKSNYKRYDDFYSLESSSDEYVPPPDSVTESLQPQDYRLFMSAASMLETQRDAISMAAIIQENESDADLADTTPVIDISKLQEKTLIALINYTKQRFRELGYPYPSQ
ncbi:hypothetical protein GPJ56_005877 [Histomonas meleagridis]|uniref:uncharacterized protein n=1 Tax=Histomonas meleagridis TaxID=135588 RepID=UPI003559BC0E|nr:hypothetical protein GPJ56_005877 [Histomonas meleagridis]KAH0798588.1 hypothetical protein GO595_008453 [Histomonas meleagridis]